jgi:cytochrome c biogenesis protein CcmG/thiol:disulfide interchange protein DsbE
MRRSIGLLLGIAALTTLAVVAIVAATRPSAPTVAKGSPIPGLTGTTLEGQPFDLASLRGRPVVINFWASWCIPCRSEFPLLAAMATKHAGDGLAVVGVLSGDDPRAARTFVLGFNATWPTVIDTDGSLKARYLVPALPQTYFVDRAGILRSIQIGEVREADFERQYGLISGGS